MTNNFVHVQKYKEYTSWSEAIKLRNFYQYELDEIAKVRVVYLRRGPTVMASLDFDTGKFIYRIEVRYTYCLPNKVGRPPGIVKPEPLTDCGITGFGMTSLELP